MSDAVTRLNAALAGRYAIERELGEGGMATVYLADDLKHGRKVALKVLKPELAAVVGAERFLAEIKTTANLQHPHILPLFDSGEADSFLFYVMPYVEGESLRDRLKREHQLPVDDAVLIATNVAEALDYAHSHGVIHRDIKPANILLQAGKPVISDFGIALAVGVAGGGRLTETGLSLGTPHYMSPEQATGDLSVGAATDIYALGAVLYEMLVGDPPYVGSTAQAILGKIITGELASATEERASVPANVDSAIRKALEKLPADRFTSAQDLARALSDPAFRHGGAQPGLEVALVSPLWRWVALGASAAAIGAASLALALSGRAPDRALGTPTYLTLSPPPGVELTYTALNSTIAISPDGRRLVFVGSDAGQRLYVQDFASSAPAAPIAGTGGATNPFFSPDGEWVAFAQGDRLRKVSLRGGEPVPLTEITAGGSFRGGVFSPDGQFIYYVRANDSGIWGVPASGGGEAEPLTTPLADGFEHGHHWPAVLPDGEHIIYTSCCGHTQIVAYDLVTGDKMTLHDNAFDAVYTRSGHLVFTQGTSLLAATFDVETLELGTPVELIQDLVTAGAFVGNFDVSETGELVHLSGVADSERILVRVDRAGERAVLVPQPRFINVDMSLDPSGRTLAFNMYQEGQHIFLLDLELGDIERFTTDPRADYSPLWSPDGQTIAFSSL